MSPSKPALWRYPLSTLHLVSHTHWDREWYQTFQQFRLRLVHVLDQLLEIFEADPDYRAFLLDGQTILLGDYLAIRPEKLEKLAHAIRLGRLFTGPWRIMPDEFLISSESIVRNLLAGRREAKLYGKPMPVGYSPDPFGHIGQMPQILNGFGIQSAVLMRGLEDEPCELWWEAPDGSRVLLAFLHDGYANAASLPVSQPEVFLSEVQRVADELRPHAAASHLLLMQGNDHLPPFAGTPIAVAYANERLEGDRLIHSTLPEYLDAVRSEIEARALNIPVIRGELRGCRRHALLPGVLSTRIWIKQRNQACENLLERWAEPFCVWADRFAEKPSSENVAFRLKNPAPVLQLAWDLLMECHFHDSIYGSGIDQVHEEMKSRFDQVEQIGEELTRQSLEVLAEEVNTSAGRSDETLSALVVYNSAPFPQTGEVQAELRIPAGADCFELVDAVGQPIPYELDQLSGAELASITLDRDGLSSSLGMIQEGRLMGLNLVDVGFHRSSDALLIDMIMDQYLPVDFKALERGMRKVQEYLADNSINNFTVRAREIPLSKLRWVAREVPAFGNQTVWIRRCETSSSRQRVSYQNDHIENEYFVVRMEPEAGTFELHDKRTDLTFKGLNRLVDGGDRGDLYNYCPPANDYFVTPDVRSVVAEHGATSQSLNATLRLHVPTGLSDDRSGRSEEATDINVEMRATLIQGVPRLDFHVVVENHARDHRLRAHFPTPFTVDAADYGGNFEVVRRPLGLPEYDEEWAEYPRPEKPQRLFTDVNDGEQGIMLAARGLPEVEVMRGEGGQAEIALTLLRCIGWLARNDLDNRKGLAGPPYETPAAQMLGRWEFDYAIIPHQGDFRQAWGLAYTFDLPLRAALTGIHAGSLAPEGTFLRVDPQDFILTAVKFAEDGKGYVVRGYNPLPDPITVHIKPWSKFRKVFLARLDETPIRPLGRERDGTILLTVRGHEIITLRLL